MWIYEGLFKAYGDQAWWPAESAFEVAVGAVLTQNTAWTNVEKAIAKLRNAGCLSLPGLLALEPVQLAELIRPCGYFNVKAERLCNLCVYLDAQGGIEGLSSWSTERLREGLLSVKGVGPETADDIVLYAFDRPVFVIDTYTRRLLSRAGLARGDEPYEELRSGFEKALPADAELFGQYHALIVRHAKAHCSKRPVCQGCRLFDGCARSGAQ